MLEVKPKEVATTKRRPSKVQNPKFMGSKRNLFEELSREASVSSSKPSELETKEADPVQAHYGSLFDFLQDDPLSCLNSMNGPQRQVTSQSEAYARYEEAVARQTSQESIVSRTKSGMKNPLGSQLSSQSTKVGLNPKLRDQNSKLQTKALQHLESQLMSQGSRKSVVVSNRGRSLPGGQRYSQMESTLRMIQQVNHQLNSKIPKTGFHSELSAFRSSQNLNKKDLSAANLRQHQNSIQKLIKSNQSKMQFDTSREQSTLQSFEKASHLQLPMLKASYSSQQSKEKIKLISHQSVLNKGAAQAHGKGPYGQDSITAGLLSEDLREDVFYSNPADPYGFVIPQKSRVSQVYGYGHIPNGAVASHSSSQAQIKKKSTISEESVGDSADYQPRTKQVLANITVSNVDPFKNKFATPIPSLPHKETSFLSTSEKVSPGSQTMNKSIEANSVFKVSQKLEVGRPTYRLTGFNPQKDLRTSATVTQIGEILMMSEGRQKEDPADVPSGGANLFLPNQEQILSSKKKMLHNFMLFKERGFSMKSLNMQKNNSAQPQIGKSKDFKKADKEFSIRQTTQNSGSSISLDSEHTSQVNTDSVGKVPSPSKKIGGYRKQFGAIPVVRLSDLKNQASPPSKFVKMTGGDKKALQGIGITVDTVNEEHSSEGGLEPIVESKVSPSSSRANQFSKRAVEGPCKFTKEQLKKLDDELQGEQEIKIEIHNHEPNFGDSKNPEATSKSNRPLSQYSQRSVYRPVIPVSHQHYQYEPQSFVYETQKKNIAIIKQNDYVKYMKKLDAKKGDDLQFNSSVMSVAATNMVKMNLAEVDLVSQGKPPPKPNPTDEPDEVMKFRNNFQRVSNTNQMKVGLGKGKVSKLSSSAVSETEDVSKIQEANKKSYGQIPPRVRSIRRADDNLLKKSKKFDQEYSQMLEKQEHMKEFLKLNEFHLNKNPIQHAISVTDKQQKSLNPGTRDAQAEKKSPFLSSNIGMVERMSQQLKNSRVHFGDRNKAAEENETANFNDYAAKRKKQFMKEAKQLEIMTHNERMKQKAIERQKNMPRPIHIKQTRRGAVQLYRNLYAFYDKRIEQNLKGSQTVLRYIAEQLYQQYLLPGPSRPPKLIKQLHHHILQLKEEDGVRKQDFPVNENEFLKLFVSEHVIGSTQISIKKIITQKGTVPVELNYMPASLLFAIYTQPKNSKRGEGKITLETKADEPKEEHLVSLESQEHMEKNSETSELNFEQFVSNVQQMEYNTLGITLGFKLDVKEILLEVPLDKDKDFVVINGLLLNDEGNLHFIRKFFETVGGKKLRNILTQKFLVQKIHKDPVIKPQFIPIGKDYLANRRARLVNYLDADELQKEEYEKILKLKALNLRGFVRKDERDALSRLDTQQQVSKSSRAGGFDGKSSWFTPKKAEETIYEKDNFQIVVQDLGEGAEVKSRQKGQEFTRSLSPKQLRKEKTGGSKSFKKTRFSLNIDKTSKKAGSKKSMSNRLETSSKAISTPTQQSKDDDSEFLSIMKDMDEQALHPPRSQRKNAPLSKAMGKMPQYFNRDSKFEVRDDEVLVPQVDADSNFNSSRGGSRGNQRRNLKSPPRGTIRLCRIVEEKRANADHSSVLSSSPSPEAYSRHSQLSIRSPTFSRK